MSTGPSAAGAVELPAPSLPDLDRCALVVIDVQQAFDDPSWGRPDNPACETNIAALLATWRDHHRPVVLVRHDSTDPASPLHPDAEGNAFKDGIDGACDLLVVKDVNSAFHGTPDLHAWLLDRDLDGIVVAGITTNHCCETTTRVGANLGHRVLFALDATHTFDRTAPDGQVVPAEQLSYITATNLHGEFATVVTTAHLLAEPPA